MFLILQLLLVPNIVVGSNEGLSLQKIINFIIVKHDIKLVKIFHTSNITYDYLFKDRDENVLVPYVIDSYQLNNFSGSFIHIIEADGLESIM